MKEINNTDYLEVGRRIYFAKDTGIFILDTGDYAGYDQESVPDLERDYANNPELKVHPIEKIDFIDLNYGQYHEEFMTCRSFRVNIDTRTLEFKYRDEDGYQEPLTDQLAKLKLERDDDKQRIADMELMLTEVLFK